MQLREGPNSPKSGSPPRHGFPVWPHIVGWVARKTLSTNFRSDQALLDVLNCLMAAAQFGPQIE